MHSFAKAVDDDEDCVMPVLGYWKLDDEVHTDLFPSFSWCRQGLKESGRLTVGSFVPLAGIAGRDVGLDMLGHLGPEKVVSNVRNGFIDTQMSCDGCIMVIVKDLLSELHVAGDAKSGCVNSGMKV